MNNSNEDRALRRMNRIALERQHLSVKAHGRGSLEKIADSCCGINSQDVNSSISSFWARIEKFSPDHYRREFRKRGSLSRTWTVRGTVHTFPSKDYYTFVFGSPVSRYSRSFDRYAKQLGIPDKDVRIRKMYEPFLETLGKEPISSKEIGKFMIEKLNKMGITGERTMARGWSSTPTTGPAWTGIMEMSYLGLITNAGKNGSSTMWINTDVWLNQKGDNQNPDECRKKLVRKYIQSYGPATFNDIAFWTGHTKNDLRGTIEELKNDLTVENYSWDRNEYYSQDPPNSSKAKMDEVILLPRFDSLMMGWENRDRIIPKGNIKMVSANAGIIKATILADGFVCGIWEQQKNGKKINVKVTPLTEIHPDFKPLIMEKFQEYGDFLSFEVNITFN